MSNNQKQDLSARPSNQKYNLLVVDDEVDILKAIKRSFSHTKYQVYTANSAEEGMKVLGEHDIQVVLSDFRMPDVDGGTLVRNVKLRYPDIVSMILTGYADFDAAVDVMNSGAAYKFLSKPWDNKHLIEEVFQAFNEYHKRLYAVSNEKLNLKYVKPGRIAFDQAAKALLKTEEQFAVASIMVSDIALLDEYWNQTGTHDSAFDSVCNVTRTCLSKHCEMFEVDIDQLMVIIPGNECNDELHEKLIFLSKALSVSYDNTETKPKLSCHLAYTLAPFEGFKIPQLLHSFRSLSKQDFADNMQTITGSNLVRLDAVHLAQKKRKQTIRNSIQQAINTNQFNLFFQPKVRLFDGVVENAEVLTRWEHFSLGWVSPLEFISLSELDGQIEKIGSWVLENSITQLMSFRKQYGDKINLSINVSPRQLQNNQIVDELSYLLNKSGLDPACIELEITKGCVIEDLHQTGKVLWQLKDLGVRIAIDDFGAGYSSFAYLSKLPVDVLKLDKILIDDLETNSDVINMLQSIIMLCKNMQIEVVAEGVENQRQIDLLRNLGCDYVQGFVYSRPVTKEDFEKIIINQPFKLVNKE
jgi:EAL domain-containing protein (putative c-di-GMP-specific phosphodiesterase class I)/FixJ family two-component response regulator